MEIYHQIFGEFLLLKPFSQMRRSLSLAKYGPSWLCAQLAKGLLLTLGMHLAFGSEPVVAGSVDPILVVLVTLTIFLQLSMQ